MPDVIINQQLFYNPVDYVFKQLGGTWRVPVLWRLRTGTKRYTELQHDIPHISQKMLTQTLKALEADGFLTKQVFAEVPPRTEYSLTEKGHKALHIISVIRNYGLQLMEENGVDYAAMVKAHEGGGG